MFSFIAEERATPTSAIKAKTTVMYAVWLNWTNSHTSQMINEPYATERPIPFPKETSSAMLMLLCTISSFSFSSGVIFEGRTILYTYQRPADTRIITTTKSILVLKIKSAWRGSPKSKINERMIESPYNARPKYLMTDVFVWVPRPMTTAASTSHMTDIHCPSK